MYKQTIGDLDTSEAQQAMQAWELSKVPTQTLKDELASRESYIGPDSWLTIANSTLTIEELKAAKIDENGEPWDVEALEALIDTPEQYEVCKHDMEMGYCEVDGCAGSY